MLYTYTYNKSILVNQPLVNDWLQDAYIQTPLAKHIS